MVSFYNNKPNSKIKFKMNIVGVEPSKVNPRLIIEYPDGKGGILVNGEINEDTCYFTVPELTSLEKGQKGKVCYEAIVEGDQYAKLWEDQYSIDSKTEIKIVGEALTEESHQEKPKISVISSVQPEFVDEDDNSMIFESPKKEENKQEKKKETPIFEKKKDIKKETKKPINEEINNQSRDNNIKKLESNIISFNSFVDEK